MSDYPKPKLKPSQVKQLTPETKFHIDYDWWKESELDLQSYLYRRLAISDDIGLEVDADEVDLVDAQTGEVRRVDGFQYVVQTYFSRLPDDFTTRTSLVDAVFCVLLANGNQPMSAREIGQRVHRSPDIILRTFGGTRIYQGIRPYLP